MLELGYFRFVLSQIRDLLVHIGSADGYIPFEGACSIGTFGNRDISTFLSRHSQKYGDQPLQRIHTQ